MVSGTVVITWCNFTNNKAFTAGGAIHVVSGSVSISKCELTNNSADQRGGAIYVYKGRNVSIADSTLTNNGGRYGGSICAGSGSVSISNSELTNNRADYGGAIYVPSGNVSISNSELTNNRANYNSGTIYVGLGSVSISNSKLMNNRADREGGAIYVYKGKNVSISDSTLTNNSANNGGAIRCIDSGSVSISDCELTNNSANRNGGAIYVNNSINSNLVVLTRNSGFTRVRAYKDRNVSISNCELTNNRADMRGGAIYVKDKNLFISYSKLTNNSAYNGGAIRCIDSDSVSISDSELTNNRADWNGGAIYAKSRNLSISDSTLTNNSANDGGAIRCIDSGSVSISDCELTNNSANRNGGAIYVNNSINSNLVVLTRNSGFTRVRAYKDRNVSISNCELTNNRADMRGGAIYVKDKNLFISYSKLTNNSAYNGGAIRCIDSDSVSISDSELTNNRANWNGGAIYAKSRNLSISDSTLTNNSANDGGAIRCIDSGSVSISDCELINNSANRNGGAIYVNNGTNVFNSNWVVLTINSGFTRVSVYKDRNVFISNCELTNNRADMRGGAIYVKDKNLFISYSKLTNNSAYNGGAIRCIDSDSVSISECEMTNNRADRSGGAIHVYKGRNVSISNCELTNNRADYGGAIIVYSGTVSIFDSELRNNRADYRGVIFADSAKTSIINSTLAKNIANHGVIYVSQSPLILKDTKITNNRASSMVDGGIIYAFDSRIDFNGPTKLSNNHGMLGGALSALQSQIYINAEGIIVTNNTATYGGGIFLRESTLVVNEPIEIYHNKAHQDGGGIYAYSSRVKFQSSVVNDYSLPPNKQSEIAHNIAENNGGGIHAVSSTIELTRSYVNIDSNTANTSGGGVYLQQSSKLYLFKKDYKNETQDIFVKLLINNNLAQYGGGILVADDTESGACRGGATETDATHTIFADCFIQTIKSYNFPIINYFNTFMNNNTATQSGADIFGGLLDRCTVSQNAEYDTSNGLEYINNTIKSSTELSISSRPVQVIFCNNDYNIISPRKGHTFRISVMAVDQVGHPMNATIRSSVVSESGIGRLKEGQAKQEIGNQCTELEYNVFSQDSSAQVELYAEGPCINLGLSRQLINISFQLCTCPIGLMPIQFDIECKCDCDPDLQQYQITNCFEENGAITLERSINTWIKVINTTNGTGYVVSSCTLDYCVQKPFNISLSNPDEQCTYNRSGVLCGECKPGLSLVLATSRCKECSNLYLLLLIPFALAGILLVALILMLNITIATGNIHGLIFYANIVAANRAIFFANLNNFLTVFVSWMNLDLGIETCFYDGMNSQAKVLLQLVFPAYLFLLMFLIIILSKYYDSFAKLLSNRNPVAALGTLVLLSYSKFLQFIVAALQNRVLTYSDGLTKTVWLFDSNVPYFTPIHIPQFVAAIIILIASGLFTVLLFFGQWFSRCSKVMIWTNNTKYIGFMDAYHAPFTPKHRYWVGLLLFALIVHNLVVAMAPDTSLPVLSAGCIAVGLISLNNRVYKNQLNEYLEKFFLLNVSILSYGTSFVVETHQQQETLAIISMSMAFILFVIVISYHSHHFILKKTKIWPKIKKFIRTGTANKKNQQPNNAMAMHQFAASDDDEQLNAEQINIVDLPPYTDGAVEEADPDRYITPPIIRLATRPDQLRLSYMDEIAPLTTEDYRRPAPPLPRVNRCPPVTHTEIGPIRNEV